MSPRICEAPGCGTSIEHRRRQSTTCSDDCRKALYASRKRSAREQRTVSLAGESGYFEALDADRGYLDDWRRQRETEVMIGRVNHVLDEYADQLPLTCRQIYYRMVAEFKYAKGSAFENSLYRVLNMARRARMIPFESIRDDGISGGGLLWENDPSEAVDRWRRQAMGFLRDKQSGQLVRLQVWCESAGMVPQLEKVATPYSVPVFSCGGFTSLTAVREIADSCLDHGVPTVMLHLGDCDPSGYSIFQAMFEDAAEFVARDAEEAGCPEITFTAERVAATFDQIEEFGLVTDEITSKDTRSRTWRAQGHTHKIELEAFSPSDIARLLTAAIERHLDEDVLDEIKNAEQADRITLTRSAVGAYHALQRTRHEEWILGQIKDDETVLREGW